MREGTIDSAGSSLPSARVINRGPPTLRPIGIGKSLFGVLTITAGLAAGERVVARDVFALDAERRFAGEASR